MFKSFSSLLMLWENFFLSNYIGTSRIQSLTFFLDVFQCSQGLVWLLSHTYYHFFRFIVAFLFFNHVGSVKIETYLMTIAVPSLSISNYNTNRNNMSVNPCYMCDSVCMLFIVEKAKHFLILAGVRKCRILIDLCK